jgi:CRP-like cAMP-binding protein
MLQKSGLVKLVSYLPDGKSRIVRLLSRGAALGLRGLLGKEHRHTAIAVNDVDMYLIPAGEVLRLCRDQVEIHHRFMAYWFEYLEHADTWITEFSTGTVAARVARLINFLDHIDMETPAGEVELLTCDEMAAVIGATPESVSRVLAEFKRNEILSPAAEGDDHRYQKDDDLLDDVADDTG